MDSDLVGNIEFYLTYVFYVINIVYFIFLTFKYYRNLKKGGIILGNIKDLKGFDCFSEEKWQEIEDNHIYFDEYLQKNEKGLKAVS